MSNNLSDSHVRLARIGKPHGIRGEVTVELFTDSPESRFAVGRILTLQKPAGSLISFNLLTVKRARWNKKILLLEFEEFSDRNTAESLRDTELYAPAEEFIDEDEGWYPRELVGMSVHKNSLQDPEIGRVTGLVTGTAQDLLEITLTEGSEVLLPFVEEIVPEINEDRHAVVITPPPGLLELNQE